MSTISPASRERHLWDRDRIRPRIGISGSFGRGNYGDELFVKTYQYWLGPWADLYMLTQLPYAEYFSELAENYVDLMDAVVLGGGDLVCGYKKIDRDFNNPMFLRRPIHVVGVGVERNIPDLDASILTQWRRFLTHPSVRSITTRDSGSKEWLESHIQPSVQVAAHPDLVCALPLPRAKKSGGAPVLGIVTRNIQNLDALGIVAKVAEEYVARGWRVRHIIGGVRVSGKKDFEHAAQVRIPGKETVYTEDLDEISRALGECDLVLSSKLHTTIVASMYGVPVVFLGAAAKARVFMESIGRADLCLPLNAHAELLSLPSRDISPPDAAAIARVRQRGSDAMIALSHRLWSEFRKGSPEREEALPTMPPLPSNVADLFAN